MTRKTILCLSLSIALFAASGNAAAGNAGNEAIVHGFVASWGSNDVERVLTFVTDDCFYHNVPLAPIKGKAAMREFLAPFFKKNGFTANFALVPETLHTVSNGNIVMEERMDHYTIGKSHFDIPVAGYFEIKDGKISVWKDYFDMAQFQPVVLLMQALQK